MFKPKLLEIAFCLLLAGASSTSLFAQDLGFSFGPDRYLSLSNRDGALTGAITSFDPVNGFSHEAVTGAFLDDGGRLKVEVPGFGSVLYTRAVEDLNTVYQPVEPMLPSEQLKITGFTRKTDAIAEDYLDFYSFNTDARGIGVIDVADQLTVGQLACASRNNSDAFLVMTSGFCDGWNAPLSVGVVTARSNVGLLEAVAAGLDVPTQIRTIDDNRAIFVSSPSVLGSISQATKSNFFDGFVDLRDMTVVSGVPSSTASTATMFSASPAIMTVRWSIKAEQADFFDLIWRDPSDADAINGMLSSSAAYFSPHNPSCRYILRDEPRIYCNNTTHDIISRGERLWVRVGHLLIDIDYGDAGNLEFLSLPVFEISYSGGDTVPPDNTFARLKDTVEEELSAAEEIICIWQSGLVQMFGRNNVTYRSTVSCS